MDNEQMIVMYCDMDGMPRAYAYGDDDIEVLKDCASRMLDSYIAGKPYPLDRSEFHMVVEPLELD